MLSAWQERITTPQGCAVSRDGTRREVAADMRRLLAVAIALLPACGRTAEPQEGAFEPEDIVKTTPEEYRAQALVSLNVLPSPNNAISVRDIRLASPKLAHLR